MGRHVSFGNSTTFPSSPALRSGVPEELGNPPGVLVSEPGVPGVQRGRLPRRLEEEHAGAGAVVCVERGHPNALDRAWLANLQDVDALQGDAQNPVHQFRGHHGAVHPSRSKVLLQPHVVV